MTLRFTILVYAITIPFLVSDCNAFVIEKGVWLIADTVTNAYLYSELNKAEEEVKAQKTREALKRLNDILQSGLTDNYIATDTEPLTLTVCSAALWYKAESFHNRNREIIKETRKVIDEWKDRAKGNQWKSYKNLFYRIRDHYIRKGDQVNRIALQKEAILYDPFDLEQLKSLDEYCRRFPECVGDMRTFINDLKNAGGILPPFLELTMIVSQNGDKGEKLNAIIEWLKNKRHEELDTIKCGVECASQLISIDEPNSIKSLSNALTDLALWQPGSEERMPVIAYLINERAKILAISKDVLKE